MVSMHTSPVELPGRADSGGMNVSIMELARELGEAGIEVDLVTRAVDEPDVRKLAHGVTLRSLRGGPPQPLSRPELALAADEFGESVAELMGGDAARYDLIHAHYWLSGLATLPVAIELGMPFVQSFHSLGSMKNARLAPGDIAEPEARLRGEGFLVTQADAVLASSAAEVSVLIDELQAAPEKLWVIPPGVDAELFTPTRISNDPELRASLYLEPERPIIVVAGSLEPNKGQELAVRALAALHEIRGWAPLLVIAGSPTPGAEDYGSSLADLAHSLGVGGEVRFVGALDRDGIADLLAAASMTLLTSHSETFGLVALESAAAGTPVIGYQTTGLAESVDDGVSGILLDSRDPDVWAETISMLLDDDARLARLQASARGYAERFTWAQSAERLRGVYEGLLGA